MLLKANNITHKYSDKIALNDISIFLEKGEVLGLLGENGAGKSTLISILSGLLKPSSGTVLFKDKSIDDDLKLFRRSIGLVPQEISLFENLTIRDNLTFWASCYGIGGREAEDIINELALKLLFTNELDKKVSTLSGGYQRRVNIAASIIHKPEIVILDEPTVGVDVHARNIILSMIKSMANSGTSVIYTSHYIDEIQRISDVVNIIKSGQLIAEFTKKELVQLSEIYDSVQIKFSDINDTVVQTLQAIPTVNEVILANEYITIKPNADFVINDVLSLDISEKILDIDVVKNTLEHKYVELTKK